MILFGKSIKNNQLNMFAPQQESLFTGQSNDRGEKLLPSKKSPNKRRWQKEKDALKDYYNESISESVQQAQRTGNVVNIDADKPPALSKTEQEYFIKMQPFVEGDVSSGRDFSATIEGTVGSVSPEEYKAIKQFYIDRGIINEQEEYTGKYPKVIPYEEMEKLSDEELKNIYSSTQKRLLSAGLADVPPDVDVRSPKDKALFEFIRAEREKRGIKNEYPF
jgi:hypothetical protein